MKPADQIDNALIKAAAKELNDLNIASEKLKIIGTSKETLAAAFILAVESVKTEDEEKLTETIINQYNFLTEEAGEGETEAAPAKEEKSGKEPKPAKEGKEPKAGKEPKPAKEPKPPKEKVKKDRTLVINSTEGSKAGEVEKLLARTEGVTQEEVTKLVPGYGITLAKLVKWERDHGAVIDAKEGRYWYRADGVLQFPVEVKPAKEAKPAKEPKPEKPAKEAKPAK